MRRIGVSGDGTWAFGVERLVGSCGPSGWAKVYLRAEVYHYPASGDGGAWEHPGGVLRSVVGLLYADDEVSELQGRRLAEVSARVGTDWMRGVNGQGPGAAVAFAVVDAARLYSAALRELPRLLAGIPDLTLELGTR